MDSEMQPGRSVGPYEIVAEVARGGMATVYRALQPSLGRFVALKVLSAELARDPDFVQRFQREARLAARLEHPNIVPIYDVGQADGSFYMAMRFVAGHSLSETINTDGPLPLERVCAMLAQVASALDYAHRQGIIHRDIKPSNILVEGDSDERVSLADFGIARAAEASQLTQLTQFGVLIGTPTFMAPEQAQGITIDYRADLYSLGVVAYLMLSGRAPFDADSVVSLLHKHVYEPPPSIRETRRDLPQSVDAALQRMLSKQPGERYESAAAFVTALRPLPDPAPTVVTRVGPASSATPAATTATPAASSATPAATSATPVVPSVSAARPAPSPPSLDMTPPQRSASGWPWVAAGGLIAVALLAVVALRLQHPPSTADAIAGAATSVPTTAATTIAPTSTTSALVTPAGLQLPALALTATPAAPATVAPTPGTPQLAGTWQVLAGNPTAPGVFNGPAAVAIDAQGNLLVAEQLNHRIQVISTTGQSVAQWGTFGDAPGQFREPSGLAIDSSGNVYVADRGNNRVQKLGPDGHPLLQFGGSGQLDAPTGVALDAQGNVYVADSGNNRIQKFAATGQAIQQWGKYGKGPGQFSTPSAIAIDKQGMLYVVDQDNDRIQKLAPDGRALAQWGTSDASQEPSFSGPTGMVLDGAGNVLVSDTGNNRIVKLSPNGAYVADQGSWGDDPGDFESPMGIALDAQGNMFVADHDNDRVQKLAPNAQPLTQVGSEHTAPDQFRQPKGVAVDGQGNIYIADANNQRVQKLSPSGSQLGQWGSQGSNPGQFHRTFRSGDRRARKCAGD